MTTKIKHKAALVLSGGGALGAAHIGAIKILEKHDYEFDFIAAVSAGAIVGAFYACGKNSHEASRILDEINVLFLADISGNQYGLISGKKIQKYLDDLYGSRTFHDTKMPLYIGATDFATGERIIIHKGKISEAVRASLSVPAIFEPYYHKELKRWLVDGGLTQNFPLDIALEKYKGDRILAIDLATNINKNVNFAKKSNFKKIKDLSLTLERTFRIFYKNQQKHFPEDERVITITPNLKNFSGIDVFKLDEIAKQGEKAAKKVIKKLNHTNSE